MSALLRFAPSPNGWLHLGHAYSALLNDRVARDLGGRWLLRIEDIDRARATPERIAGVTDDLAWLGLAWPLPVRRQSEHLGAYAAAADSLRRAELLYPCFCSRGEVADAVASRGRADGPTPRDPDGVPLYPGTCRRLGPAAAAARIEAGDPHAWRLDNAAARRAAGPVAWRRFDPDDPDRDEYVAAQPERWGDVVLQRREVPTSYHLSVVLDDSVQAITHVVRGRDLEHATDIHALLGQLLGLPAPRYHHHRLLADPSGAKLAKSRGSDSLSSMREAGVTPAAIRADLGFA